MKKIWTSIQRWWLFNLANPVVRKGEAGGFKWVFRRFWLEISTLSGNFKCRFTADEHPYGALLSSDESNDTIHGFCQIVYQIGKLLTTEQKFADDIQKAIVNYNNRLNKKAAGEIVEDELEENIAIEEVKQIQEYVEATPKERRRQERDSNGRFKKVVKELEKSE